MGHLHHRALRRMQTSNLKRPNIFFLQRSATNICGHVRLRIPAIRMESWGGLWESGPLPRSALTILDNLKPHPKPTHLLLHPFPWLCIHSISCRRQSSTSPPAQALIDFRRFTWPPHLLCRSRYPLPPRRSPAQVSFIVVNSMPDKCLFKCHSQVSLLWRKHDGFRRQVLLYQLHEVVLVGEEDKYEDKTVMMHVVLSDRERAEEHFLIFKGPIRGHRVLNRKRAHALFHAGGWLLRPQCHINKQFSRVLPNEKNTPLRWCPGLW